MVHRCFPQGVVLVSVNLSSVFHVPDTGILTRLWSDLYVQVSSSICRNVMYTVFLRECSWKLVSVVICWQGTIPSALKARLHVLLVETTFILDTFRTRGMVLSWRYFDQLMVNEPQPITQGKGVSKRALFCFPLCSSYLFLHQQLAINRLNDVYVFVLAEVKSLMTNGLQRVLQPKHAAICNFLQSI